MVGLTQRPCHSSDQFILADKLANEARRYQIGFGFSHVESQIAGGNPAINDKHATSDK